MKTLIIAALMMSFSLLNSVEPKIEPLLESFEELIERNMKDWNVPGLAVAVVKDNKTIYSKGFGVKKLGGSDKVDTHTLFQVGSLTKSITATLVALMVDEGKLKWTDKVINSYPEFMLYDPWVTREFEIQDLLCQRSGLPAFAGDMQSFLGYSSREILENLRYIKPVTSFRSAYAFQNSFFVVAAEVLRRVSGRSWDSLVQERLFAPLGMNESSQTYEDYNTSKNVVSRHVHENRETKLMTDDNTSLKAVYTYAAAGGINSTLEDMSQWLKLQISNGVFNDTPLISEDNMAQTHRRYVYMGKMFDSENYYGLGWAIRDYSPYSIIWHNGGTTGSSSVMAFIPEEKIGLVILSNTKGTHLNYALAWEFFDLYYKKKGKSWSEELLEKQVINDIIENGKPPEKKLPPLPLDSYTGVYYNKMYGKAEVSQEKGELILALGPQKTEVILKPWNHDTFVLLWPQVSDVKNTKVYFTKTVEGFPTQMEIEAIQQNSDGVFLRLGEE